MIDLQTLAVISVLFLVCVCVVIAWALQRRELTRIEAAQEQMQQHLLGQLNHLQKQQRKAQSLYSQTDKVQRQSADAVERSILALNERLDAIEEKQQELAAYDPEIKLYQQAKRMVEAGATVNEVVDTCGIPKAEAELLYSMAGNTTK